MVWFTVTWLSNVMYQFSPFSSVPSVTKLRIDEYKYICTIYYMKQLSNIVKDWKCYNTIFVIILEFLHVVIIPWQQHWRGYSNAAVLVWLGEWVDASVRASVHASLMLSLVGRIQTTVLVRSLSNFTCKLWRMRGGTLLIFGHGVKGQVNFGTLCIKPSGHDAYCSFSPITFKLHM